MAEIEELNDINEWELAWDEEQSEDAGAVLLLKYSPICPTSETAEQVFRQFVKQLPQSKDLRIFAVDVIAQRALSQRIAADTKVKHESPQAMLLSRGRNVIWHASHNDITEDALKQALDVAHV